MGCLDKCLSKFKVHDCLPSRVWIFSNPSILEGLKKVDNISAFSTNISIFCLGSRLINCFYGSYRFYLLGVLRLVQANAGHLWRIRCNWLLEKPKFERQKVILEVPTQLFRIWNKNMKHGQSDYLPKYITFIYGN